MFEVSVKSSFSAAHHLRGYKGKCEAHHGHNWEVEVFVRGKKLDKTGLLIDFRCVKECLRDVLGTVDHSDINTLDAFKKQNPTSENIAMFLFKELRTKLDSRNCRVHRVCVRETPETRACYSLG